MRFGARDGGRGINAPTRFLAADIGWRPPQKARVTLKSQIDGMLDSTKAALNQMQRARILYLRLELCHQVQFFFFAFSYGPIMRIQTSEASDMLFKLARSREIVLGIQLVNNPIITINKNSFQINNWVYTRAHFISNLVYQSEANIIIRCIVFAARGDSGLGNLPSLLVDSTRATLEVVS